jgi:acetylornithine deacetylase/succinyl-diaminopimelate desuccinylase-like protein
LGSLLLHQEHQFVGAAADGLGVEEPPALIHAPNESVDRAEIATMALTEALFLQRYAAISTR